MKALLKDCSGSALFCALGLVCCSETNPLKLQPLWRSCHSVIDCFCLLLWGLGKTLSNYSGPPERPYHCWPFHHLFPLGRPWNSNSVYYFTISLSLSYICVYIYKWDGLIKQGNTLLIISLYVIQSVLSLSNVSPTAALMGMFWKCCFDLSWGQKMKHVVRALRERERDTHRKIVWLCVCECV